MQGDYKKDVEDVKETAIKMLTREYSNVNKQFLLMNGYRRVDPRRGAEYILDIGIKPGAAENRGTGKEADMTIRCGKMPYTINSLSCSLEQGSGAEGLFDILGILDGGFISEGEDN